jgi:hypothetical protein
MLRPGRLPRISVTQRLDGSETGAGRWYPGLRLAASPCSAFPAYRLGRRRVAGPAPPAPRLVLLRPPARAMAGSAPRTGRWRGRLGGWASAAGRSTAQGAVLRLRGLYCGRFATPHRYPAKRRARSETGRPSRLWISGQLSPAARRRSTSAFSGAVQRCMRPTPPAARCAAPGGWRRPRCR